MREDDPMKNDTLIKSLDAFGIPYDDGKLEKLERFYELLIEKNKVMNLTAITDYDEVMIKHFADSLVVLKYRSFSSSDKVFDLGTGGGFPGIPLKIFLPDTEFVLADSVNKKLLFIKEVCDELSLKNISVLHGRAEDLAHDEKYREKYDVILSRAVANLSTLSELSLAFIKKGGLFISYKGASGQEELQSAGKAIQTMGGSLSRTEEYSLPGGDSRCLIFISKTGNTPKTYPRKAGTPSKKPLYNVSRET